MTTSTTLALEDLLQPITGEAPCGVDLTFSDAFDQIARARREDDAALDQGEWVAPLKTADWPAVVRLCSHLLQQQSKDIRLAGWLTEALARTQHFAGLAQGFALVTALCTHYGQALHPMPEGDDADQRSSTLAWLIQRCALLLRELPITATPAAYSSNDYLAAQALKTVMERDPEHVDALADGKPDLAQIQAAVRSSGRAHYQQLLLDMQVLRSAFSALSTCLDALLGAEAPSYRVMQGALDEVTAIIERNARQLGLGEAPPALAPERPAAAGPVRSSNNGDALGSLDSRLQALQQLRAVAEYFRRTEPHSPVAYLAEKAAHWGELPLHDWLRAVVKDGSTLAQLEEVLGVERPRAISEDAG